MRILFALLLAAACAFAADSPFLGKWDLTITGSDGRSFPSWLEVTQEGTDLKARLVGRGGSAHPVRAAQTGEELTVSDGPAERPERQQVYKLRAKGNRLEGTMKAGSRELNVAGVTAPKWPKTPPKRKPGTPVKLFNGTDLTGWLAQNPDRPLNWIVKDGALANQEKANNIYSDKKFLDFKLDIEFNVGEHSNSGIYLRGRHEIQVLDDFGQAPESHKNGAIYGFLTPKVNASKKAGEWQKLTATIVANHVTIVLNGQTIIDDQEIPGITGGALDSNEAEPGAIMLQGDHGPVMFRNIVVTPLK